jgi:signal peptidase I
MHIKNEEKEEEFLNKKEMYDMEENDETKKKENFFVELIKYALLAFIIVIPFRMFVAQPFIVNGASMSPTFDTGEYLIVDRFSYHFTEPERGDVIIFRSPNNPSKFFIKRVIGLPGELVRIQNGTAHIVNTTNGDVFIIDENYLSEDIKTFSGTENVLLGNDDYFVMGDNRNASSDSREWGPVEKNAIIGRAFLRLTPPQKIHLFPGEHKTQFISS